jgi:hypothetical protein
MDPRVEDERVVASVPSEVHEPNQLITVEGDELRGDVDRPPEVARGGKCVY